MAIKSSPQFICLDSIHFGSMSSDCDIFMFNILWIISLTIYHYLLFPLCVREGIGHFIQLPIRLADDVKSSRFNKMKHGPMDLTGERFLVVGISQTSSNAMETCCSYERMHLKFKFSFPKTIRAHDALEQSFIPYFCNEKNKKLAWNGTCAAPSTAKQM